MLNKDRAMQVVEQINSGMVEVYLQDDPVGEPLTPDRFLRLNRIEHLSNQLEFRLTSRGKVYLRSLGYNT